MNRKPTDELDNILENTEPDQLDAYFRENRNDIADARKAFYYYMKDLLNEKRIRLKDVYSFAGVSESYGSKVLTMEKHVKDRDLIIRFCLAGHFNWDQTSRALKLYGMRELYSRDPRDACLIVAINNRIYDLYDIDEMLLGRGLAKLSTDL